MNFLITGASSSELALNLKNQFTTKWTYKLISLNAFNIIIQDINTNWYHEFDKNWSSDKILKADSLIIAFLKSILIAA